MHRIRVLFPLPLAEPFDYLAPGDGPTMPGCLVLAPLGPRKAVGVVWPGVSANGVDDSRLKRIEATLDLPALTRTHIRFIDLAARHLVQPPGMVLAMSMRLADGDAAPRVRRTVHEGAGLAAFGTRGATPARTRVMTALGGCAAAPTVSELARAAGVSSGVVHAMIAAGALRVVEEVPDTRFAPPDPDHAPAVLSPEQQSALEAIRARWPFGDGSVDPFGDRSAARYFRPVLLEGVTGSGKTEVYLEAIARRLREAPDDQALILLPEIALTQQVIDRVERRFGARPAQWHSGLSPAERTRTWREVAAGRARLVVGARSALFLPFQTLKVIVVDEEHDPSFKQEEGLVYNARDLAVLRGREESALVVLASATPSLETLVNAGERGRYEHVRLTARHGVARLPEISLVDMRAEPPERDRWLSPALVRETAATLARGEQVLFYLNRRGYAPLTLCRACGHRMKSPDTDSWLVEHRYSGRLVCHLTGFWMPRPAQCPQCLAPDPWVGIGPGVERLEEEARERFPDARIAVFSSDTVQSGEGVRTLVGQMERGEIDILVGTQIVAKGHNFPRLTLVGVIDADAGLRGGDLRAGERTFQLLSQVAGRAGRADRPGRALIQTWEADQPLLQALAAGDREGFLETEIAERKAVRMPPFGRLAAVIVSASGEAAAREAVRAVARAIPADPGVDVLGPAPAPLAVVRGRWRHRFLAREKPGAVLASFMARWHNAMMLRGDARAVIDMDPQSFL
jgi:primosomal protein N' (replication factor Y)